MVTTLPFVAAVVAVKLFLEFVVQFPGVFEFGEVGIVLTAGVFLTGFMLAGTMADYKESEKLPGELACTLETIEEILVQGTVLKPTIAAASMRQATLDTATQLRSWLFRAVSHEGAYAAL